MIIIADADPEEIDPSVLPPAVLNAVDADSFWCLSRLLNGINGIQDNYITAQAAQPGIRPLLNPIDNIYQVHV
jgi:hypothetical protein